RRLASPCK
ncbi:branched-chain amino acid transport family protein, partial [Chlamydia psittaci 84-8471/1]